MRVAIIADVHGNLPALEAVVGELEREPVDVLVSAGDVLLGPFQAECLALLAARGRAASRATTSASCSRTTACPGRGLPRSSARPSARS